MKKKPIVFIGGLVSWGLTLWPLIQKLYRFVLDAIGLAGVPGDLRTWREVLPDMSDPLTLIAIAIGLVCLIYATSGLWWRIMRKFRTGIRDLTLVGAGKGSKHAGIRANETIGVERVNILGVQKGVVLNTGPESRFQDVAAHGTGEEGSIGFDIEDSARTKMRETSADGFRKGVRLKNSPDSDLTGARAGREQAPQIDYQRRIHQVKLPEGMQKSGNDEKETK